MMVSGHFRFSLYYEIFLFTTRMASIKRLLFRGLLENWREYRFYRKTRNKLLLPTYFSVFGLVNIQQLASSRPLDESNLWCQLHDLTNRAAWKDNHHFSNPDNFCLVNGKLMVIDYGGLEVQDVLAEYEDAIFNGFDPDYRWEDHRKSPVL